MTQEQRSELQKFWTRIQPDVNKLVGFFQDLECELLKSLHKDVLAQQIALNLQTYGVNCCRRLDDKDSGITPGNENQINRMTPGGQTPGSIGVTPGGNQLGSTPGGIQNLIRPTPDENESIQIVTENQKHLQQRDEAIKLRAKSMSLEEYITLRNEQCLGPEKIKLDVVQSEKLTLALEIGLFYYYFDQYHKEINEASLLAPRPHLSRQSLPTHKKSPSAAS